MQLQVGANFAGYVIERCLGTGGMGSVYLARHPRLERSVALKLMTDGFNADPKVRAAFDREVSVAARLDHPNIVAVYDRSGPEDDALWLTMRYIAGGDAGELLEASPRGLAPEHAVRIVGDAAEALDFAHDQGVVHRDVKPANLMVEYGPRDEIRALLTDFGIARTRDDTVTMSSISASFAYAAPERFSNLADHRSDIYSLGCTLYHLLTGTYPFPRDDQAAVIAAHLTARPPSPRALRPDLPAEFDAVIATALAKKPHRRYPSCGALAEAAHDALSSVAIPQLVSVPDVARDVDSAAVSRKRTRPLPTPDGDRGDEGPKSSLRPKSTGAEDVPREAGADIPREARARVESVEPPVGLRRESAPTDRGESPGVPSLPESGPSERVEFESASGDRPSPESVSPHESGPDPVAPTPNALTANDRGVEPVGARRLHTTLPDPDLPNAELSTADLPDPHQLDPTLPDYDQSESDRSEPGDSNPPALEADPSNRDAVAPPSPIRSTDPPTPGRRRVLVATVVGTIVCAVGIAVATALMRAPDDIPATPSPVPAVPAGLPGRSTTPTAEPVVVQPGPTRTTKPPTASPPAESSALDVVELPAPPPDGSNPIQPPAPVPLSPPTEDAAAEVGRPGSNTATPPPTSDQRPVTGTTVPPTTAEPTTTPTIPPSTTPPTTGVPPSTTATEVPISTTVPG
ncbi:MULTISPECIES: serine/threonine-protein kinase [Nocardia]|uniref:serine/threonine-protein kinase n=1 Tax=Nocardia TaxID=1817 RepID=UPI0013003CDA|nr:MULTISPECIES: serine/threonine-protein kinase [Nocardia]